MKDKLLNELNASEEFFNRSTRNLTEEHAGHRPAKDMMTSAQQIAHVAQTIDWFLDGASNSKGFDMDFEGHMKKIAAIQTMAEARNWLKQSYQSARDWLSDASDADLNTLLPEGIMGGQPRWIIIPSLVEHAAHHRGALTVYARTLGITPPMPYMEMQEA